jgi:hypothetical protein
MATTGGNRAVNPCHHRLCHNPVLVRNPTGATFSCLRRTVREHDFALACGAAVIMIGGGKEGTKTRAWTATCPGRPDAGSRERAEVDPAPDDDQAIR